MITADQYLRGLKARQMVDVGAARLVSYYYRGSTRLRRVHEYNFAPDINPFNNEHSIAMTFNKMVAAGVQIRIKYATQVAEMLIKIESEPGMLAFVLNKLTPELMDKLADVTTERELVEALGLEWVDD